MARDEKELSTEDLEGVTGGVGGVRPSLDTGCPGPVDVDGLQEHDDHLVTPDAEDRQPERH